MNSEGTVYVAEGVTDLTVIAAFSADLLAFVNLLRESFAVCSRVFPHAPVQPGYSAGRTVVLIALWRRRCWNFALSSMIGTVMIMGFS
jgi:hypothetical protein